MTDEHIRFIDSDHIFVNGKQFVSLKRFGEAINCKLTQEEVNGMVEESLKNRNACLSCLRQFCPTNNGTIRINCPLFKASAV